MSRQAALWALAALLGIALTAGITWATSQLTSQHIGLSSEPISAGSRLAPAGRDKAIRTAIQAERRTLHDVDALAPPRNASPLRPARPPSSPGSAQGTLPVTPARARGAIRHGHATREATPTSGVLGDDGARAPGPRGSRHEWREQRSAQPSASSGGGEKWPEHQGSGEGAGRRRGRDD